MVVIDRIMTLFDDEYILKAYAKDIEDSTAERVARETTERVARDTEKKPLKE